MSNGDTLSKGEIIVLFGLFVLGGQSTTKELVDLLKISERYLRNIIIMLRKKKIINSLGASEIRSRIVFGSPFFSPEKILEMRVGPKEKVHILAMDFPQLLEKHPEILKWAESTLKIDSPEKLEEHLREIRKEILKKKKE